MRTILVLFALLCLSLPALADTQDILYDNGVLCPSRCWDAWAINYGFAVSDTFVLTEQSTVTGFNFVVWEYPDDRTLSVDWEISSDELGGGTVYGSGTTAVTDPGGVINEYGFEVSVVQATGLNVSLAPGQYWFTLQNAVTRDGNPVYWDENSGVGCTSPGCPSLAEDSAYGTIPSETFSILGTPGSTTPEPSSLLLLSTAAGLLGILKRRIR